MNQVDRADQVQVVHPGKLAESEDRTLSSVSLIEEAEFDGPYGCLHPVADLQLGADML